MPQQIFSDTVFTQSYAFSPTNSHVIISTAIHTYKFNLLSFEVVFSFLLQKFPVKAYPIVED